MKIILSIVFAKGILSNGQLISDSCREISVLNLVQIGLTLFIIEIGLWYDLVFQVT